MPTRAHPEHPDIDTGMWQAVDRIIAAHRGTPGALITVLRECQDVVGYLPPPLLDEIGRGMNLPASTVFGVASFYSLFSMTPKGRHKVRLCLGTACYVKGIREVLQRVRDRYELVEGGTSTDRRFSLEAVRCLGACGLAPVMVVDRDVHGDVSVEKVVEILDRYQ